MLALENEVRPCRVFFAGRIMPIMAAKKTRQDSEPQSADAEEQSGGRFSLHRLSAAFARLTSNAPLETPTTEVADRLEEVEALAETDDFGEVVSPRMIVEGMLFVGSADGRPLTSRELAAHIRDVSPTEIDALIDELNSDYETQGTGYRIAGEGAGYQMQVREDLQSVRRRFLGKVREVKLTPQAIEVLSIVAYRQPLTAEHVTKLRGSRSHSLLNQLVRRGLLCLERPPESPQKPNYFTTERFNRLFGIESTDDLPSSEDLDDS